MHRIVLFFLSIVGLWLVQASDARSKDMLAENKLIHDFIEGYSRQEVVYALVANPYRPRLADARVRRAVALIVDQSKLNLFHKSIDHREQAGLSQSVLYGNNAASPLSDWLRARAVSAGLEHLFQESFIIPSYNGLGSEERKGLRSAMRLMDKAGPPEKLVFATTKDAGLRYLHPIADQLERIGVEAEAIVVPLTEVDEGHFVPGTDFYLKAINLPRLTKHLRSWLAPDIIERSALSAGEKEVSAELWRDADVSTVSARTLNDLDRFLVNTHRVIPLFTLPAVYFPEDALTMTTDQPGVIDFNTVANAYNISGYKDSDVHYLHALKGQTISIKECDAILAPGATQMSCALEGLFFEFPVASSNFLRDDYLDYMGCGSDYPPETGCKIHVVGILEDPNHGIGSYYTFPLQLLSFE